MARRPQTYNDQQPEQWEFEQALPSDQWDDTDPYEYTDPASGGAAPSVTLPVDTTVTGPKGPQAVDDTYMDQFTQPVDYGTSGGWSGGGTGAGSGGYAAPAPSGPAPPTIQSLTQQALLNLLQTPQDVNEHTLWSSPAMRAYRLGSQRSFDRDRAALAERAAYEGWNNSGAFDTELQGLRSARGEGEAQYMGKLSLIQMEDAKERLMAGLQYALQTGDASSARDLQLRIAELNGQIQREQLGFNYAQLQQQANRDATLALLAA